MIKINGPFATLPLDLSCVDKSCRLNDIKQLHALFDESELVLVTSDQTHNYFLEFSNDEIKYDVEELSQALTQHAGSLFNNENQFKFALKMHLPQIVWHELAKLLQFEISKCFKQVFTEQGELQNWFKELFIDNQLAELYQQFGEVNVKFELFHIFALRYCELFKHYVSPGDKDCSTALIELMKTELLAYRDLASSLANLEKILTDTDDSYKGIDNAQKIYQQANKFFFSNKFLAQELFKESLEAICKIIITPNPISLINRLQSKISLLTAQTNNIYWQQFAGTISVFIGSFLIVAGLISMPVISPFITAGLISSGLTFFGGGSALFVNGLPEKFTDNIEDFVNQTKKIEFNYQQSL